MSITGGSPVTEGGDVVFTVTANPAPTSDLQTYVKVTETGSFGLHPPVIASNWRGGPLPIGTSAYPVTIGTSGTVDFTVVTDDDEVDEADGAIHAYVDDGTGYYSARSIRSATVAVADNDATSVTLAGAVNNLTPGRYLVEGTNTSFTVTLGRELVGGESLAVPLTFGGAATHGADYTITGTAAKGVSYQNLNSAGATVTFTGPESGRTAKVATLTLTATPDIGVDKLLVSIGLGPLDARLSGGATGTDNLADFNIVDLNFAMTPVVTVTPNVSTVTEGPTATAGFTVSASPPPDSPLTVNLTVADGSASDFVASGSEGSQTVTIPAGAASAVYTVGITDDQRDEPRDMIRVTATDGTGYLLATSPTATVTVIDDDATTVVLTIPDTAATKGLAGSTASMVLKLNRGLGSGEALSIPLAFAGGTVGTDFTLSLQGAPRGISLSGSVITFTGPASGWSAASATVLLTASANNNPTNTTVTVSIPSSSTGAAPILSATGLAGGATGSRTGDGQVTLVDLSDQSKNICERYEALGSNSSWGRQSGQEHAWYYGQVCNLRNKGITSLRLGDFDGLPNLVSLFLDKNALTSLPEGIFDGLSSLKELRIGAYDLRTLSLPKNPLTSLPENLFEGLSELRRVDLSLPKLTTLPEGIFDGLTKLKYVNMYYTRLTTLPENLFDGLSELRTINLGSGSLTTLPEDLFDGLSKVLFIRLWGNPLTSVPAGLFDGLSSLRDISLSETKLTTLPSGLFDGLSSLKYIYLGNIRYYTNFKLDTLPWDIFEGLPNLTLFIYDTDLTCLPKIPPGAEVLGSSKALPLCRPVAVSIAGGSAVTEGGDVTFTLTADPAPAANLAVTVSVSESGNVAASGQTGARTVTIGTGGTVDFTVSTEDDDVDETDGAIAATVTAGTGYTVGSAATASVVVRDDEAPTISIAGGSAVTEGGDVTFTLTADPVPATDIQVTVTVSETGSFAALGETGARTVTVGASGTVDFTVSTEDDAIDEADGSIAATVTAGTGYTVGSVATASVAVADNDVAPLEVNISSEAGGAEGDDVTFTITAIPAPSAELPVRVTVTASGDYGVSTGPQTVSIPTIGSFTLTLSTTDDTVDEEDGSVTLTLEAGAGYAVGPYSSQTVSITDDDVTTQPQVDNDDTNPYTALIARVRGYVAETANGEEHVNRWQRVLKAVGEDDAAFAGLTPMTASEAQGYADKGWTRWNEVVTALTALEAAAQPPVQPTITIAGSSAVTEGGDVTFTLTASPAPAANLVVRVSVTESGNVASGGATGTRTVTVGTGGTVAFTVSTEDDDVDEADGSIAATVTAGTGYTVGSVATASVVVRDDEVPTVSIAGGSAVTEGGDVVFTLTADPVPAANLAVTVSVSETGNVASSGATGTRTVTIGTGGTVAFTVSTENDAVDETDGSIAATVTAGTGYTVGSVATASVVVRDDEVPTISIAGGSAVTEGGDVVFTLTANPAPAANLAVTVSVSESGNVAASGQTGARTVTIDTSGTVAFTVSTENDAVDETDGSIAATVTAGTGYTVGSVATASVVVRDDEVPTVSIAGGSAVTEGGDVVFTLTADPVPAASLPVTVSVTESGNVASSGTTGTRTVTIGTGGTGGTVDFTVATEDDAIDEPDGSIAATVTTGTGYTVGSTATASVAVADNDVPPPEVNITSAAGGSEGADVTFVITATPAPTAALPVSVTITAVGEYGISAGARTVSIPTGGSFTLRLSTTDDTVDEDDGSVTLTLGTGAGYTVGSLSSQTASITDDDVATQQQQVDEDNGEDDNPYGAYADLIATVRGYAGETESGEEHVKRWQRVLKGLGESDAAFANLTPMAASEAQTYADKGWARWEPVAMALTALEAATQLPVQPTVSITGGSAVTEGGDVTFTLTATPPPAADLAVTVSVSETGSFTSAGATGARTVTIGAGGTVDFTVTTEDDEVDETDGVIEAMVTAGTGYAVAAAPGNGASVAVADNDVPVSTKPLLSVSDASGEEGEALEFVIRLSSPLEKWMTVVVRTRESSPVSARYGQDFRLRCPDATSVCSDVGNDPENYIVMNFRPGETEKTVSVSALDDAHDDDGETFEVYIDTVYFVEVEIADGVGVGTIRNSDPIPAAWLGRFGRTVSQQVVDAVTGRFKAVPDVPNGGLDLTVAGEHLSSVPLEENEGALRKLLGFESVSGEQLVAASSFNFTPAVAAGDGGAGGSGQWAFWGQGAISSFSGREDDLSLAGDVTTALLGAEWSRGRWQAGAALSHSWGSGGYEGEGDAADGSISTTLLGLFPYGRYALTPRLDLWAIGGYGWGNLTLKPQRDAAEELNTTTNLVMGAVGLEGVVLDGGAAGLSLTTTADALVVETTSAEVTGLKGSEATVSRLRLGLEATRPIPLDGGASLLPSLEVGIRQDGGDAETGYGVEVGAGVVWKDPQRGISAEAQGRTLVTHTEEEFREQGLALSFAWEPSPDKRGPSLSMGHTMGASASGGMDALLQPVVLEGLAAPGGSGQQFEAEFAYGFPAFNDRLTLTPGVTLAFSPDSRSYGLLWSLAPYSAQGQGEPWDIALEAERQEYRSAASPTEHSLKLRFSLLF